MTPDYMRWEAASGSGHRTRTWWLCRYKDGPGITGEYAKGPKGRMRTFGSLDAARKAAEELNAKAEGSK